ncbi:MAG TPA: glycosyltransferase, partial [Terriglobales bacterium]|nr:glycosyltransferase [Terriglobales bacterium]
VILVAPAVLLAASSWRGEREKFRYYRQRLPDQGQSAFLPPVSLIVPVKGHDQGLQENLASLASLDYPDYELIIAARSPADVPPDVVPPKARVVFSEGQPAGAAEKLQNLLAAVRAVQPHTEVLAFADSDGRVCRGWLRALVAPLAEVGVGAATGYRVYLPEPAGFWPALRSAWNAVIFGTFGPGKIEFVWGGAMALRKDLFFRLGVESLWARTASDDYVLTGALRSAGLRLRFAPGALVVSSDRIVAGELLRWIQRQLIITRIYAPRLWALSLFATLMYCTAMVACLVALIERHWNAGAVLAFLLAVGMLKGTAREKLASMALPGSQPWFQRYGWIFTWLVPLATWTWLYGHLASAFTNVIEWRGYRYRLSRQSVLNLMHSKQQSTRTD